MTKWYKEILYKIFQNIVLLQQNTALFTPKDLFTFAILPVQWFITQKLYTLENTAQNCKCTPALKSEPAACNCKRMVAMNNIKQHKMYCSVEKNSVNIPGRKKESLGCFFVHISSFILWGCLYLKFLNDEVG